MMSTHYLTLRMAAEGSGVAVSHHGIAQVELSRDLSQLTVQLDQWIDEAARLAGSAAAGRWNLVLQVAAVDLAGGLAAGVRAAIVAVPPFVGGTWAEAFDGSVKIAKRRKLTELSAQRARLAAGHFGHGGKTYPLVMPDFSATLLDALLATQAGTAWRRYVGLSNGRATRLSAAEMLIFGRARNAVLLDLTDTLLVLSEALDAINDQTGTLDQVAAIQWPA